MTAVRIKFRHDGVGGGGGGGEDSTRGCDDLAVAPSLAHAYRTMNVLLAELEEAHLDRSAIRAQSLQAQTIPNVLPKGKAAEEKPYLRAPTGRRKEAEKDIREKEEKK